MRLGKGSIPARISPANWSTGGGALSAASMLAQADGLALVCALALDSAAYDGPDDDGEVLGEVTRMCSRLLVEARKAIRVADDLLAEL